MNKRYERDQWQRGNAGQQGPRGGNDDRRHASRDDNDRWPNRVEGQDRNRWDERDDRYAHADRQDYRYGAGPGHDYRFSHGSGQEYRGQEYRGQEYRGQEYRGQEYNPEHRSGYNPENRWASENRWSSENRPHGQVPYAGSGEPRWGEPSRHFSQDPGDPSDYVRRWDRPQGSSQYGGAYDANRFGRGNYGTYGSTYGHGSEWSRDWNRSREGGGFFGRGPKGYTRSDDRIREDVCDRLSFDDEVDASDITVTVQGGEVTLEGTVPDRHSKHRAEDIVENVHGVRDVHNRLKARRGLIQEVGDRLMGREEEHEQGHAGSGTRNSPAGTSRTGTGTSATAFGTSSNLPNGNR